MYRLLRSCSLSSLRLPAFILCSVFSVAVTAPALRADTITYDLTPDAGSLYGGTVVLTLSSVPPASGQVDYTVANGGLDNVVFNIDGQTFDLADGVGTTLVRFLNGQLNDITFSEQIGSSPDRFSLHTTSVYDFAFDDEQMHSTGTFTLASSSPVPEPGTLALLGTGLLGGAGSLYRRKRVR